MALGLSNRDGGKTSERGLYDAIGALVTGEVLSGFRVRQDSPVGMSVRIGGEYNSTTGADRDSALVRDGLRSYSTFTTDGTAITAAVPAPHATLDRIDVVVIYVDKSATVAKTPVDNANGVVKAKVVAGTPNASPVAPDNTAIQASVGAGNIFVKLAQISTVHGALNILQNDITDIRTRAKVTSDKIDWTDVATNQDSWHNPTLQNGWVNFGSGFQSVGYMKDSLGFVHLRGVVKSGTVDQAIFTLPAGYRPIATVYSLNANGASSYTGIVNVSPTGVVKNDTGTNAYQSLDNVVFDTRA